jgi:peptide/nickel transport system substrate-binding protein
MRRATRCLLLLGVLALAACGRERAEPEGGGGGRADGTPSPRARPTFVHARGKDSPTADPALATDGESAILLVNVFDTLVRFQYGTFETEPALAESWEIAPDKRSATFRLREGVRFHDGTPLDGPAAALSFERQRDKEHRFHFTKGEYPYWGDMFDFVTKVSAPDARTVRFEASEPLPPFFLSLLAMFSSSIVSPKALEKGEAFVQRNPIGTGPFRLESWALGSEIVLAANDEWWGGPPKLGRLVLKVMPELHAAYAALETGTVHGIDNVAAQDVARVRANPKLALKQVSAGLSVCYLSMNNDAPPFDDARVRRAVALAIDKPRLVRSAYEGLATPIATLLPPGMEGHLKIEDRRRDVEAAKRLLAEAGAAGAKVRLQYPGNPRPYLPDPNTTATQIREDLREIGLDVELKKEEWSPYLALMQDGRHQMGILGWSPDVPDADNYLYVLLDKDNAIKGSANNVSFYRSDAFHEKVLAARRSHDPAERRRLYEDAQRIAFEDCPLVPLVAMPRTAAMTARAQGFVLDPVTSPRFAWTSLSE